LFSALEDLRSAFTDAKEGNENLFSPKRTLPVASANIIAFASNDTRLVVGLENGSVAIYDTALLFTSGTGEVSPLKVMQVQPSPLRQILPNPSTDPNLCDLFAIVGDGRVLLFNMQLEPQGGWAASDLMTQPISGEFYLCAIKI
jgi:nucleoporin NUP159